MLAYTSDESGRNEVYLRPFPGSGGKKQVSTGGGDQPAWARNGRELFYLDGDKMMVVDVTAHQNHALSSPRFLFERPMLHFAFGAGAWPRDYDVAPDGQRFLIVDPEHEPPVTQIHLVTAWFEELERLVPTEN